MIRDLNIYVFIDGAYLEAVYADFAQTWFGHRGELDYNSVLHGIGCVSGMHWKRGFYYDCQVKKKGTEIEEDFLFRKKKQEDVWSKIRSLSGGHLRTGKITGDRKQRQKGVDVLIAVNVLSHVARGDLDKVVLLAGDADFVPLVKAVVEMGTVIDVAAESKSVSTDMMHAPDFFREITNDDLFAWTVESLKKELPFPKSVPHTVVREKSNDYVEWSNGKIDHFVHQGETWYLPKPEERGSYTHSSIDELKRYVQIKYSDARFGVDPNR